MKNIIKIITIFGIVTPFFVYSMELGNYFLVRERTLDDTNPLLQMRDFYNVHSGLAVPEEHSSYQDKSLGLILSAPRILILWDEEKKIKETLETVCEVVCDGVLVTSEWAAKATDPKMRVSIFSRQECVSIFSRQEPISIFTSVEDLFKPPPFITSCDASLIARCDYNQEVDKKKLWMEAVFRGQYKRQENFNCMCDELIDYVGNGSLKIAVPKVVMDLIVSCLSKYHINKENAALIRQAKKKFDKEQQSQLSLDEEEKTLSIEQLPTDQFREEQEIWRTEQRLKPYLSELDPSEAEDRTEGWLNPLTQKKTYLDDSGNFTLDKAKKVIEKGKEDCVNSQGTFREKSYCNPLGWLCVNACNLEPLNEENRLKLATFFLENGASDKSIIEAYLFCQNNNRNQYVRAANSKIVKLLSLTIKQRKIRIDSKELTRELQDNKECATFDSLIKKITNYVSKNPGKTGLTLVSIPILLYFLINLRR